MACCNKLWILRVLSIMSGLAAFAVLGMSILLFDWIQLHFITRTYDQPPHTDVVESSGEVYTTASPPFRHKVVSSGICRFCVKEAAISDSDILGVLQNDTDSHHRYVSTCWVVNPFIEQPFRPDQGHIEEWKLYQTYTLIDRPRAPSVKYSLFAGIITGVVGLIVTSIGMAMNNMVILVGAALYCISGLSLGVSSLEFYHSGADFSGRNFNVFYHDYTYKLVLPSFGWPNERESEVWYWVGPGVYSMGAAFVLLCAAAAFAAVHFRMGPNMTTERMFTRKQRDAIQHAPRRHDMVQIVTKM